MRKAGFKPDVNNQGNKRLQTWTTDTLHPLTVDFLIPPINETDEAGAIQHIESDLAAIVSPGLDLAFKDRRLQELSDFTSPYGPLATRNISVCDTGAFTVLKALAFWYRPENKEAYDLFYEWSGVGIPNVAESLAPLLPNSSIEVALSVIERDFCNHEGMGPIGTAQFITQGLDDAVQADVVGYAQALLHSLGRL